MSYKAQLGFGARWFSAVVLVQICRVFRESSGVWASNFVSSLLCDVNWNWMRMGSEYASLSLCTDVFLSREYPFQITFPEFIFSNCVFVWLLLQVNCGLSKRKRKGLSPDLGILDDKVRVYNRAYSVLFLGGDCN